MSHSSTKVELRLREPFRLVDLRDITSLLNVHLTRKKQERTSPSIELPEILQDTLEFYNYKDGFFHKKPVYVNPFGRVGSGEDF